MIRDGLCSKQIESEFVGQHGMYEKHIRYLGRPTYSSMLKVMTFLKLSWPALCKSTILAYTPIGDEPVGRPRTNGLSGVGWN
jgi:hypothetical protein